MYEYKAFISHAHTTERVLANSLKTDLERFVRPPGQRRSMRLFLDVAILTPSPSLWDEIKTALDSSEYLILLASDPARASQWVEKEINHWVERRGVANIILAVASGSVAWDPTSGDFDPARTTCIPGPLRGRFTEEPLYIDLRDIRLNSEDKLYWDSVASICSRLLAKPKDELVAEDLTLHKLAEAENLTLRSELALARLLYGEATRFLLEAYRKSGLFSTLLKAVVLHNDHGGAKIWQRDRISNAVMVESSDGATNIVGCTHRRSYEPTIQLVDAHGGRHSVDLDHRNMSSNIAARKKWIYFAEERKEIADEIKALGDSKERCTHVLYRLDIDTFEDTALARIPPYRVLAVSHDGTRLAYTYYWGLNVHAIDLENGITEHPLFSNKDLGSRTHINELRFSACDRFLAWCGGNDSHLDNVSNYYGVVDLERQAPTCDQLKQSRVHSKQINSIDISPDSSLVITGSTDESIVVSTIDGIPVRSARLDARVDCVRFILEGRFVVAATQKGTSIWRTSDLKHIQTLDLAATSLIAKPDSAKFWAIGDKVTCVDLDVGQRIADLTEIEPTGQPAYDIDGKRAVIVSRAPNWFRHPTISVFDARSGDKLQSFVPGIQDGSVHSGRLSPSGDYLALTTSLLGPKEDSTTWRQVGSAFTVANLVTGETVYRSCSDEEGALIPTDFCFDDRQELIAVSSGTCATVFALNPWTMISQCKTARRLGPIAWREGTDLLAVAMYPEVLLLRLEVGSGSNRLTPLRTFEVPDKHLKSLFFDLYFDTLYFETEGGADADSTLYKMDLANGTFRECGALDIRANNSRDYHRLREVAEAPFDERPLRGLHIYDSNGPLARVMRDELLEPLSGLTFSAEQFLDEIASETL